MRSTAWASEALGPAQRGDESLIEGIRSGDSNALAALYDRYGQVAYRLAYQTVRGNALAEEVVQDVFLAIWKNAASYDGQRGSVRAWLLAAVRYRCIDALRKNAASSAASEHTRPALASPRDEVWETLRPRMDAQELRRALTDLPTEQRATIYLAYYRGMTHREIAAYLRLPLGTVKGRLRLALAKLRASLPVGLGAFGASS